MREYNASREKHKVYDSIYEVPSSIKFLPDWKNGEIGEWVLADDKCVIQVLRKGSMLNKGKYRIYYLGTCTGTYICSKESTMDTQRRKNIYSIGGNKTQYDSITERKNLTGQETMFAKYVAIGIDPAEAYLKSFGTDNRGYARVRAGILMKTERVVKKIDEELDDVFEELGVDLRYLIKSAKETVDDEEIRASDKLTALKMLWEAKGVVKKEKQTQITGAVFQGFDDKQLDVIEKPKKLKE